MKKIYVLLLLLTNSIIFMFYIDTKFYNQRELEEIIAKAVVQTGSQMYSGLIDKFKKECAIELDDWSFDPIIELDLDMKN